MALERLLGMILRAAELVFAVIVLALTSEYIHKVNDYQTSWDMGRFIYTDVVAALATFLAIIWLFPFSSSFIHWPVDLFMSINWFVVFGLLVNLIGDSCGYIFNWGNVAPRGSQCGKFKAIIAFSFLSAICWLVSALLGLFWVRGHERRAAVADSHITHRRRWYRRSRV
jgi:hypothetical protein